MITEIFTIIKKNLFLIVVIALISLFSFQLGRISGSKSEPIKIEQGSVSEILKLKTENEKVKTESGVGESGDFKIDFRVVVSKNSNKYHFLWCPGAKQIKEENKIYFNSEEEAIAAGYILAGNCSK